MFSQSAVEDLAICCEFGNFFDESANIHLEIFSKIPIAIYESAV